MVTATHVVRKQRSRFAIWAWSPIIVLRIALFGVYAGLAYASVIAFIAGVPVFDLTTPEGYTSIWAVLLGTSAVLAAVGATTQRWEPLEKWASLALSSFMMTYVGALNLVGFVEHDLNRQFIGAISIVAVILPVCRFIYLAAQTGKRKLKDVLPSAE